MREKRREMEWNQRIIVERREVDSVFMCVVCGYICGTSVSNNVSAAIDNVPPFSPQVIGCFKGEPGTVTDLGRMSGTGACPAAVATTSYRHCHRNGKCQPLLVPLTASSAPLDGSTSSKGGNNGGNNGGRNGGSNGCRIIPAVVPPQTALVTFDDGNFSLEWVFIVPWIVCAITTLFVLIQWRIQRNAYVHQWRD